MTYIIQMSLGTAKKRVVSGVMTFFALLLGPIDEYNRH